MENNIINNFNKFNLSPELLKGLQKMNFSKPSAVQDAAINPMLDKKDVLVKAPTGTGKTAAFGIPVIENIDKSNNYIQTIILCPTRELVLQTLSVLRMLTTYTNGIRTLALYGGEAIQRQITALKNKPQIIVSTPGRMLDHIKRRTVKLNNISCVVLDEADCMLDMGFREDIGKILNSITKAHQTVLFSATLSKEIQKIAETYQDNAEYICIKKGTLSTDNIKQYYSKMQSNKKTPALIKLLQEQQFKRSLVFVSTKVMAEKLSKQLANSGLIADTIHGNLSQGQRNNVMQRYRRGKINVLVATDIAAHGIDVEEIDIVVNYDIPGDSDSYTHRIGRTGRADKTGVAYTFIVPQEQNKLKKIIGNIKLNISPIIIDLKESASDNSQFKKTVNRNNRRGKQSVSYA